MRKVSRAFPREPFRFQLKSGIEPLTATFTAQCASGWQLPAVGRLAGGIAHDFNNILGAILGYGELAQNNLGEDSVVRRQIDQIRTTLNRRCARK
jgi:signal transduction histidine kinase